MHGHDSLSAAIYEYGSLMVDCGMMAEEGASHQIYFFSSQVRVRVKKEGNRNAIEVAQEKWSSF